MQEPIIFEDTITYQLAKVSTAYRNAIERHLGPVGLHSGQTLMLIELWREDGLRPIDLAQRLSIKAPTVTNILNGLDEMNLIRIKKDTKDKRASRVFLTALGKNIRSDVEQRWVDMEAECVAGLPETDRFVFNSVLRRLLATYTGKSFSDEE
jgi:MarR family transcriptional regulator, organic hydroperoxide resistance regulator